MEIRTKPIDPIKLTLAIRQLENQDVWHECYDIEEGPIEDILAEYGIHTCFTEAEKEVLTEELLRLAAAAEIAEAARWAHGEHDPLLLSVPDRPAPSPRGLEGVCSRNGKNRTLSVVECP